MRTIGRLADAALAAAVATLVAGSTLAVASLAARAPEVTRFPASDVAAAFAKGRPLLETEGYKVHASRREAAGMAEVHVRDTDILYVLEGAATIVTGGTVVDGRTTATDELRGASILGGESRSLEKGDVMVIPNGTPHWFKEVRGPFLYYVVKVTNGGSR